MTSNRSMDVGVLISIREEQIESEYDGYQYNPKQICASGSYFSIYKYTSKETWDVMLYTRDKFRELVFKRDNNLCVICKAPAVDAHHIIERRLFADGGYYLDNGVSVCSKCHLKAESTELSCYELRKAAGIKTILIPEHLYPDQEYDKWGNSILPNGNRLPGELFEDLSVQKIIKPVLNLFVDRSIVKYPRTFHLPWSPGLTNDDRVATDLSILQKSRIIVHVKMDGENTTFYNRGLYARSLDGYTPHPSRVNAKILHSKVGYQLPEGWRLCGENLQGKHSIHYKNLRSFFYGFSIWDQQNMCLSWDETLIWFRLLEIEPCPVIYNGPWDEDLLKKLWTPEFDGDPCEGYVVRIVDQYHFSEFRKVVAKFVRPHHVQSHAHWMQRFESNELKKEK